MEDRDVQLLSLVDEIKLELVKISPAFRVAFQDPASEKEIKQFVQKLGPVLPTELVSFFRISKGGYRNGPCAFAYDLQLTNINDCIDNLRSNIDIAESLEDLPLKLDYADVQINPEYEYSYSRIPIASATRMQICIDLSPTNHGKIGQLIFIDSEYKVGIFLAETLSKFLEGFRDDLMSGYYEVGKYSDDFLSCKTEISLANWQWSQRWLHVPFDRSKLSPISA